VTPLTGTSPSTLNLQDPDSLSLTKDGKIVLDSQADGQLVFVSNPATTATPISALQLNNGGWSMTPCSRGHRTRHCW
jgi:hypothetical protein